MEKVVALFDKPDWCMSCPCCYDEYPVCKLTGKDVPRLQNTRPDWSPLVSVDSIIGAMKEGIRNGIKEAMENEMS